MFVNAIKKQLRRIGLDVSRYREHPRHPPVLRNTWMHQLGVEVVIDVGANVGQYGSEIRTHGYKDRILSFEPLSHAYDQLQTLASADPKWTVFRAALGRDLGETWIHVAANSYSSSMLPILPRHLDAAPDSSYASKELVPVTTLDSLLKTGDIPRQSVTWLKIDVQGWELEVLQGGLGLLRHAVAVECELSLVELYRGEPLAHEVIEFLAGYNFRLSMVTEAFFDPATGQSLQLNGVFLRDNVFQEHIHKPLLP